MGSELAGYVIESVIGRGGMGVVYLAEHRRLNRKVALKVLAPERARDERFRRRFLEESRIAAGLNHPNVIPIHDADEVDGVLFLAMRYVEGTDLRTLLAAHGRLEPARALRIVGQVGSALDAAHERGLIHRDVTAANVLVGADDHAYLCDFGLSKRSSSSVSALTASGEVLGTVAYMPPELIEEGEAGPRADVYSLGCLFYQCLAGFLPFDRGSDLAVLWAHMQEAPPAITAAVPELPVALDAVFARVLAKSPEDRYPTCHEFVHAVLASGVGRPLDLPAELDTTTPLIGRRPELEWLRKEWAEARGGAGRVVFVSGVRGAGKTRLAAELAQEARAAGAVRYASCLRQLEAVRALLADLPAADQPTLAVVDDLDAADAAAIDELARIQDALDKVPVLLLATYRADVTSPALEELVSRAAAQRDLQGLDEEGVAAIGRLYLDPSSDVSPAMILAATGGIPQRAHTMLLEWARDEASRRLAEAADYASAGRSSLRAAEAALVDHVADIQSLAEQARLVGGADAGYASGVCPYKGLAAFEPADAHYFHGRERLVAELVARLVGSTLLGVVGPSGSGKSSVVRAGLLPAVAGGVLPGSQRWPRVLLRPGELPVTSLRDALATALPEFDPDKPTVALDSLRDGDRLFLVVDQLEEVFTLCPDEDQRTRFLAALTKLARDTRGRVVIVVAIRAAFYGRCAGYSDLAVLLGDSNVLVGPMQADELRRAIELPAQRVGLVVESRLVDALVAGVAGQPGGLPLLATTLLELWQRRDGDTLRLADYVTMGGVQGAVARLAEDAYGRLSEAQQKASRSLLLRLAQEGEGATVVRRRAQLAELDVETNEDVARALTVLADSRLVTVSEGTVEVAHEALLREWPRLHSWLEEDAQGRRLHQHLIQAAGEWENAGRDPAELYRGPRLASALEWSGEHDPELNELERQFLAESRDASERETKRVRRTNRRLRGLLIGVACLFAAALAAGLVALIQRGNARDSAADARVAAAQAQAAAEEASRAEVAAVAQRLGAQALIEDDLDRSLMLARTGVELDDTLETRSNLLAALLRSPAAIGILHGDGDRLLAMTSDGQTLYVGDDDGTLYTFDTQTRQQVGDPAQLPGLIRDLALSPDGRTLAAVGATPDEQSYLAAVRLGPATTQVDLLELSDPAKYLGAVAFPANGGVLATAEWEFEPVTAAPTNAVVVLRDPQTGLKTGSMPMTTPQAGSLLDLAFTVDGHELVWTSDTSTDVLGLDTGAGLYSLPRGGRVALSPDGGTLGVGAGDGSVTLVGLGTGDDVRLPGGHNGQVVGLSFSPDGKKLASTGDDGDVIVWDVAEQRVRETFRGHAGSALSPVFSRSGSELYTAGFDGKVIVWDIPGSRRLGRQFTIAPGPPFLFAIDYSPTGTIATASDNAISLWDARTLEETSFAKVSNDALVGTLVFDPSGTILASVSTDNRVALWNTQTGALIGELDVPRNPDGLMDLTWALVFAPDGKSLVTATGEGTIARWSVDTLEPSGAAIQDGGDMLVRLAISPDGRRVAASHVGGDVVVWDLRTRAKLFSLNVDETTGRGTEVAFSSDGRLLATGDRNGTVALWDSQTGQVLGAPMTGPAGQINSLDFSPDGRVLASTTADGMIVLWDVPSRTQIGAGLPVALNFTSPNYFGPLVRFGPGTTIAAVTDSGQASLWTVDPARWKDHACTVAGRNLTSEEWRELLRDRPYEPVCTDLPA